MNLLHIIDDEKFINICKETFKIEGLNNTYIKSSEINLEYLNDNNFQIIFVHFLRIPEINFFYNNTIIIPKVWMFWGADGFSLPSFYNIFLDKESRHIALNLSKKQGCKRLLIHLSKILFKKNINNNFFNKKKLEVINSFDYIVPIVPGDYNLLKAKYDIIPPMFHFNYVTPLIENSLSNGNNILLGNSATLSNNHMSILKRLEAMNMYNVKVYIPLNYGDVKYREYILNYIKNKPQFIPLIDFMSLEDYNKIIASCSTMIMNHKRQQALGNIILGLMNGTTIYLNNNSTLYQYLENCGFIIKSINDNFINNYLNEVEKFNNILLAKKIFGKDNQVQKIKKLINILN